VSRRRKGCIISLTDIRSGIRMTTIITMIMTDGETSGFTPNLIVTRHDRRFVYTGIRVVIINSIPLCGTGRVDATTLGIGSVDIDTNTDVDADSGLLWQAKRRWSGKKIGVHSHRRVASLPLRS
jgi:hypothetical protein